jgi:uncharacterized protein YxeA
MKIGRMNMSKKILSIALSLVLTVTASVLIYNSERMKNARFVKALVKRNIDARGGAEAWQKVSIMRVNGRMDLGKEMSVPYVLEQKRPDKMCFKFEFNKQNVTQCVDGDEGWKIAPFRGLAGAQRMSKEELREMADSTDPYGLLYNYIKRDIEIEMLGHVKVGDRDAIKLKLTMDKGAERWLYVDAETALELKMEMVRTIARRPRHVVTVYSDWRKTDGLLIAHRQETKTEGDPNPHFLTVELVNVNPWIEDAHFAMPKDTGTQQLAKAKAQYEH